MVPPPEVWSATTRAANWSRLASLGRVLTMRLPRAIQRNKLKFIAYTLCAFIGALLVSMLLGEHYDVRDAPRRAGGVSSSGSIIGGGAKSRKTRQVLAADQKTSASAEQTAASTKDPFAARPRIQTRNGHLVIEASQDKNIDFKTSGSRGTVTLNGHKIDQLLDVVKALEKSAQFATTTTTSAGGKLLAQATASAGGQQAATGGEQYELLLRNLFGAGERFIAIERRLDELTTKLGELAKQTEKLSTRLSKRLSQVSKMNKQQETMLVKLKRNDCLSPETGQPVCKNGATCLDSYDGFKCICPPNYEGPTCELDVDECAKFRGTDLGCQNGARCVNKPGGYVCECTAQYHGIHCTELHDDCSLSSSRSLCGYGKCVNLAREVANQARYECVCEQGWTTDGTHPACVIDINECLVGGGGTYANASSSAGGDLSTPWSNALVAAYPCSQHPFVECTNLPGSFKCGPCPAGYAGNGRVCRDIDECAQDNGGCSRLVECVNTPGSRRCGLCPPGYQGDGTNCQRVSACSAAPNGGCHPMASCVELDSVSLDAKLCYCRYPYTGDGVGPSGCRLAAPPSDSQSRGPAATGGGGGTSNQTTTSGSISEQQQTTTDDCNPTPCLNGAQCRLTEATFECLCPVGWTGRLCEEPAGICGGKYYASQGDLSFPLGGSFTELLKMKDSEKSAASAPDETHFKCQWSISVASNMSVKLTFANLANLASKSTDNAAANKRIQFFSINGTAARGPALACPEYLDIWDTFNVVGGPEATTTTATTMPGLTRLLGRFCSYDARSPSWADQAAKRNADKQQGLTLITESNTAQLEYTYSVSRRSQFGEPSLAFNVSWSQVEPPCGGELPIVESGSVSSPGFPDFYRAGAECRYLIRVPPGKRVRIQFGELNLLAGRRGPHADCTDSLKILDGSLGPQRALLFVHCANQASLWSKLQTPAPIISSSSTVELLFESQADSMAPPMRPHQKRGFYLTYASEPAMPGCGGLYSLRSGTIKSADYEPASRGAGSVFDDTRLAVQLSRYLDTREGYGLGTIRANSNKDSNRTTTPGAFQQRPYKTRCEYEIRPADRARDHKISLDWLEMPYEAPNELNYLSYWARSLRCYAGRLTVYDGNPLDGGNRTELATFCAGDKYNASLPMLMPVVSSGHILLLVYESSQSSNPLAAPGAADELHASQYGGGILGGGGASGDLMARPSGFKLHYSTICTALYYQRTDRIQVDLNSDVSECIYHIILPPNNTISLMIVPIMSDSLVNAADGSCNAQAIFMDGAIQGGKAALLGAERQLRSFKFASIADQENSGGGGGEGINNNQTFEYRVGGDLGAGSEPLVVSSASQQAAGQQPSSASSAYGAGGGADANTYWQYSSSHVHDIKEFEVCKLPLLTFDSIWNHLSLLFRLKPRPAPGISSDGGGSSINNRPPGASSAARGAGNDGASGSSGSSSSSSKSVRLTVRYQAEPSCGGIISEPREGAIPLEATRRIDSLSSFPITATRYEQLHRQQFTNPCAWILRAGPNQIIQLAFVAPEEEIQRRYRDWLGWSRSRAQQQQSVRKGTGGDKSEPGADLTAAGSPLFSCGQVFEESIELYEPSLNRTRQLCPLDLLPLNSTRWTTQSNIVYIRLRNNNSTTANNNTTIANVTTTTGTNSNTTWPGRRPLMGGQQQQQLMVANYKFLSLGHSRTSGQQCGGKLILDSGLITSPRFPFNYPANSNCVWLIQTQPGQQIRLNFTKFDLEPQSSCWFDYLELRNGPGSDSPLIGRFCNSELQSRVIVSHSSYLWLRFKSDSHLNRGGFEIYYDSAQTGCGGKLTAASGQIDSPNYPAPFAHSSECEWTIEVNPANRIELTVVDLDLSSSFVGGDSSSSSCLNGTSASRADYLEIIDSGPIANLPSKSLGKFCHKSQIERILSTSLKFRSSGNQLLLIYKSQALDNSRGFRLNYRTVCQPIELFGFQGVIESPGFPSSYLPHLSCGWTIRGPLGSRLTLALTDLDLEETWRTDDSWSTSSSLATARHRNAAAAACKEDFLNIWAVQLPANATNSSSSSIGIGGGQQQPLRLGDSPNATGSGNTTTTATSRGLTPPRGAKLVRTLCGQLSRLNASERLFELNTSVAFINFESDRNVDGRGFRFEWQSQGCGGHYVGETVKQITFNEQATAQLNSGRPTECFWSLDLSQSAHQLELSIDSDMRAGGTTSGRRGEQQPCDDASLTIYDGLDDKAAVLSRNCDAQTLHQQVRTSTGQALVKFYSSGRNNFGRSFTLSVSPQSGGNCLPFLFDLNPPYNKKRAGFIESPNYPELYEPTAYHCSGLLQASAGRWRIQVEELDIPVDWSSSDGATSGGQPAGGLLTQDKCRSSSNYLTLSGSRFMPVETYCGKLDKRPGSKDLARTNLVLDQELLFAEFYTSGGFRGRFRLAYERLCGSLERLTESRTLATPNYPGRPNWPKSETAAAASGGSGVRVGGGSSDDTATGITGADDPNQSEHVCIWGLTTEPRAVARLWPWSAGRLRSPGRSGDSKPDKIHLNIVDFVESNTGTGTDCLRIFEGVELSLRQSEFNLTDIDLRQPPKVKICKRSDLKHSSLSYVSQGTHVTLMITGNTVAKVRVRPFENFCGGEFTMEQAEFASPGYPQPYTSSLDCFYSIVGSPGSRINLKFLAFDLPEGVAGDSGVNDGGSSSSAITASAAGATSRCDSVDFVDIRQVTFKRKHRISGQREEDDLSNWVIGWSGAGRISASPPSSATLWPWARHSSAVNATTTTSTTPAPAGKAKNSTVATVQSSASAKRLFELAKLYYFLYESKFSGYYQGRRFALSLGDFYDNSRPMGRYCGKQKPTFAAGVGATSRTTTQVLQDEVLVRFRSHGDQTGGGSDGKAAPARGFLAEYKLEYGGLIQIPGPKSPTEQSSASSEDAFIGSPQYPGQVRYNKSIRWTFETRLDWVLQFDLVALELGPTDQDCQDTLSLYDGLDPATSGRLSAWCGHLSFKGVKPMQLSQVFVADQLQPTNLLMPLYAAYDSRVKASLVRSVQTSSNVASLVYENFQSVGMFLLRYKAISKSSLAAAAAAAAQSQMTNSTTAGESAADPSGADQAPIREQEALSLFDGWAGAGSSLSACSRDYRLSFADSPATSNSGGGNDSSATTTSARSVTLVSPNWPQEPTQDTECHWLIYTQEDTNIRLSIEPPPMAAASNNNNMDDDERYSSSSADDSTPLILILGSNSDGRRSAGNSAAAAHSFVAIHDGATRLAPQIARFRLPAPPKGITSSGRHLFVRYVHATPTITNNSSTASSGGGPPLAQAGGGKALFKARASIGECGGQYHVTSYARIRDRPYQSKQLQYANNLLCTYYIYAANQDEVIVIDNDDSSLRLASEPTNSDCSVGDYIEIRHLPTPTVTSGGGGVSGGGSGDNEGGVPAAVPEFGLARSSAAPQGKLLGRFCAGRKLDKPIESPGSAISIEFRTDAQNTDKGWKLQVMSSAPTVSCPRAPVELSPSEAQGRFTSPSWPHGLLSPRHCKFKLRAPANQSIEVTFVRLQRPTLATDETSSAAANGAKCADQLSYLDDNEAAALSSGGGSSQSLRESTTFWSEDLLQPLIKEVPCRNGGRGQQQLLDGDPAATMPATDNDDDGANSGGSSTSRLQQLADSAGFRPLTADEYFRLALEAPPGAFTIKTDSSYLVFDYDTKGLLPNEGFVAIYRLTEDRRFKCGGELTYTPARPQMPVNEDSGSSTTATTTKLPTNLLQSAKYGEETLDSDGYIQCSWRFNFWEVRHYRFFSHSLDFEPEGASRSRAEGYYVLSGGASPQQPERVAEFTMHYLVFQVLEIPPLKVGGNGLFVGSGGAAQAKAAKLREICGLNRLLIHDGYRSSSLIACGNVTAAAAATTTSGAQQQAPRWVSLDEKSWYVSLRTKNLRSPAGSIYRGMRAYYYQKNCLHFEKLTGARARLRSHADYANNSSSSGGGSATAGSSYSPGVCSWDLGLDGNEYELWFDQLSFRPPENAGSVATPTSSDDSACDTNNPDLDYLEVRDALTGSGGGDGQDSPVLARICYFNQQSRRRKALLLEAKSEVSILFVAGIKQLAAGTEWFAGSSGSSSSPGAKPQPPAYGFDITLARVAGKEAENEFCRAHNRNGIYRLIGSEREYRFRPATFSESLTSFLYPKNTHCVVNLTADEGGRFTFTFKDIFELESSRDCQNDYIQIDDILRIPLAASNTTLYTSTKAPKRTSSLKTTSSPAAAAATTTAASSALPKRYEVRVKRIGRWCGNTRPKEPIVSSSNRIRITFHSNERIEGKGFQLEYSVNGIGGGGISGNDPFNALL